ncbi:MAG TPA: UDP-glucose/GDP-mannose dehydrogenase family protein [Chloroflexia bacterium]|nr:UDP-glucose/GDP-mannose dehydrogenase family protein [Chloroflexia bacterium]
MSKIAVIGTGYVGLVTGTCFADLGNDVVCVDVIEDKVKKLNKGISPIYEPGLEEIIGRNLKARRLHFTTDYELALKGAKVVFIAVGTPEAPDGSADMQYVQQAARSIGKYAPGNAEEPLIIVNKSTVPIGTGDLVGQLIRKECPPGFKLAVVSNPEFLREGQAVFDFLHPDRIVLGSEERWAGEEVAQLYEPLGSPVMVTDLRTAEMVKYASNAMLATYISFINEIALICEKMGADVKEVVRGMGYDKRINAQFLQAGVGFGGSCFPKDVKALAHMAEKVNTTPYILNSVLTVNQAARDTFAAKVVRMLGGSVHDKKIGVLGLSFKADTDDMRESPAIDIIKSLQAQGASVQAFDPVAMEASRASLDNVTYCADPYEAAEGVDALLLITAWNEFKQLDVKRLREAMRGSVFVDGRNVYDPIEMRDAGFTYSGVGRS